MYLSVTSPLRSIFMAASLFFPFALMLWSRLAWAAPRPSPSARLHHHQEGMCINKIIMAQTYGKASRSIVRRRRKEGHTHPHTHVHLHPAAITTTIITATRTPHYFGGIFRYGNAAKPENRTSRHASRCRNLHNPCSLFTRSNEPTWSFHFISPYPSGVRVYVHGCFYICVRERDANGAKKCGATKDF